MANVLRDKGVLKDVGIGIAGIVLTILFDFATVGFVDPKRLLELQQDQTKLMEFLVVPFDLWLISFSLLLGALLTCTQNDRGKLVSVRGSTRLTC